jgi:hypothetical protein
VQIQLELDAAKRTCKAQPRDGVLLKMNTQQQEDIPRVFVVTTRQPTGLQPQGNYTSILAALKLGRPFLLRTYENSSPHCLDGNNTCFVWEAGRATGAAPTFFDPIRIALNPNETALLFDGGVGQVSFSTCPLPHH